MKLCRLNTDRRGVVDGDIQKLVKDIYTTPPGLVAKAKSMLTEE